MEHYYKRTTGYSDVQDLLQWNRRVRDLDGARRLRRPPRAAQVKVEGGGTQKHGAAALVPGAYQAPPATRASADNGGRASLVRPLLLDKAPPCSPPESQRGS